MIPLSILIPRVTNRPQLNPKLEKTLYASPIMAAIKEKNDRYEFRRTVFGQYEVVEIIDNKIMTIGEKRGLLYQAAHGEYSWQIDDDDYITIEGLKAVLSCIESGTKFDAITFQEDCLINGERYTSDHSCLYEDWAENEKGFDYVRTPFYKDVIRTIIARKLPFLHIRYGEDIEWSRRLKPFIKRELHLSYPVYFYVHDSRNDTHNERYGIVEG